MQFEQPAMNTPYQAPGGLVARLARGSIAQGCSTSGIIQQGLAPERDPPRLSKWIQPYDRATKRVFMFRAMVADTLRVLLTPKCAELLDFSQLSQTSSEHVPEEGGPSINDCAWTVPSKAGDKLVTFLFEFQWQVDHNMTKRVMNACSKKAENLLDQEEAASRKQEHLIVPVVLYLGEGEWTAAASLRETGLFGRLHAQLDRLQMPGEYLLMELQSYRGPRLRLKRNLCAHLLRALQGDIGTFDREIGALKELALEQGEGALIREVRKWIEVVTRPHPATGERRGSLTEGREDEMTESRPKEVFPGLRARLTAEGRREGLVEGRNVFKKLLVTQCRARFGEQCASALAALLKPVGSQAKLDNIGSWLVKCDSADEFLDFARAA